MVEGGHQKQKKNDSPCGLIVRTETATQRDEISDSAGRSSANSERVRIRRARKSDAAAIELLIRESFREYESAYTPEALL
jgi:hypothetical protein